MNPPFPSRMFMGWPSTTSKGQLLAQMFAECTIMGWEYDITPEEHGVALTRLDALMAELAARGMLLGYCFPCALGMSSPADPLGCPDAVFSALAVLGAERLCPTMGKTQARESRLAVTAAMKALRAVALDVGHGMHFAPGTIRGSGNKPWATRSPWWQEHHFVPPPVGHRPTQTPPRPLPGPHVLGTENQRAITTEDGRMLDLAPAMELLGREAPSATGGHIGGGLLTTQDGRPIDIRPTVDVMGGDGDQANVIVGDEDGSALSSDR